jgi:hypothetical protein
MLHHYTEFIPAEEVGTASENVVNVATAYNNLQSGCTSNPFGTAPSAANGAQLFPAF